MPVGTVMAPSCNGLDMAPGWAKDIAPAVQFKYFCYCLVIDTVRRLLYFATLAELLELAVVPRIFAPFAWAFPLSFPAVRSSVSIVVAASNRRKSFRANPG